MYLATNLRKPAAEFVNSAAWADMKRCLMERRPPAADAKDEPHVASAKGHQRASFERCITVFEAIPFEFAEPTSDKAFERPAVQITED